MSGSVTEKPYNDDDFTQLIEMHKFYFDLLVKGAGFAATAQAATVAIGGGRISDPGQIQLVAIGVAAIASFACIMFSLAIPRLTELDSWIGKAREHLDKPWRPHADMLPKLAIAGACLNFLSLVASVIAFTKPSVFAAAV
jgi:hypothetical protein